MWWVALLCTFVLHTSASKVKAINGILKGHWQVKTQGNWEVDSYVTVPDGTGWRAEGTATYPFQSSAEGTVKFGMEIWTPDGKSDSFILQVGDDEYEWHAPQKKSWGWADCPHEFNVGRGDGLLVIKPREDGASFRGVRVAGGPVVFETSEMFAVDAIKEGEKKDIWIVKDDYITTEDLGTNNEVDARLVFPFTVEGETSSTYEVSFEVELRGNSDNADSFKASVDDSETTDFMSGQQKDFVWREVAYTYKLSAGAHNFSLWIREDGTDVRAVRIGGGAASFVASGKIEISALSGSNMGFLAEGDYLTSTDGTGNERGYKVLYHFSATQLTEVKFAVKIKSPNGKADSFYVSVDGGPRFTWHAPQKQSFAWAVIPKQFTIASGMHTLVIEQREDGCSFSRLKVKLGLVRFVEDYCEESVTNMLKSNCDTVKSVGTKILHVPEGTCKLAVENTGQLQLIKSDGAGGVIDVWNSVGGSSYDPIYLGCYANQDDDRVSGHVYHKTIAECNQISSSYFAMEYPQGDSTPNLAECLPLPGIFKGELKADSECEVELNSDGQRLGGGKRVAMYGPPAKCDSIEDDKVDDFCGSANSELVEDAARIYCAGQVCDKAVSADAKCCKTTDNSGTTTYKGVTLTMQDDGDLVLTHAGSTTPLWNSDTKGQGTGPYSAVLQENGEFVVYDMLNKVLWTSDTAASCGACPVALTDYLVSGGCSVSRIDAPFLMTNTNDNPNCQYELTIGDEGVLRYNHVGVDGKNIFSSDGKSNMDDEEDTEPTSEEVDEDADEEDLVSYYMVLEDGGNLVVYHNQSGVPSVSWESDTDNKGTAPYKLLLQDNGPIVLVDSKGEIMWQKGTEREECNTVEEIAGATELLNEGTDCFSLCGQTSGPCPAFCGTGYCCKKGLEEAGCTSSMGTGDKHLCVPPPGYTAPPKTAVKPFPDAELVNATLVLDKYRDFEAAAKSAHECLSHDKWGIVGVIDLLQKPASLHDDAKKYLKIATKVDGILKKARGFPVIGAAVRTIRKGVKVGKRVLQKFKKLSGLAANKLSFATDKLKKYHISTALKIKGYATTATSLPAKIPKDKAPMKLKNAVAYMSPSKDSEIPGHLTKMKEICTSVKDVLFPDGEMSPVASTMVTFADLFAEAGGIMNVIGGWVNKIQAVLREEIGGCVAFLCYDTSIQDFLDAVSWFGAVADILMDAVLDVLKAFGLDVDKLLDGIISTFIPVDKILLSLPALPTLIDDPFEQHRTCGDAPYVKCADVDHEGNIAIYTCREECQPDPNLPTAVVCGAGVWSDPLPSCILRDGYTYSPTPRPTRPPTQRPQNTKQDFSSAKSLSGLARWLIVVQALWLTSIY